MHVYTYIEANRRGPDVAVLPPNYGAVVHVIRRDQGIMQKVLQLVHLHRILQANKIRSNFNIYISFAGKISSFHALRMNSLKGVSIHVVNLFF